MAHDFKSYLATQVVAEKQSVTYRSVSRALKVHVNVAKCMLYDFYEQENKKRPGSIYATYLIAGIKKQEKAEAIDTPRDDDGEQPIPSSPPPFTSSMLDPSQQSNHEERQPTAAPIRTISLIREEGLDGKETQVCADPADKVIDARQQYERITSIHIYSLSPGRLQDLVVLTDVGRDLFATTFVKEDPLQHNKTYGVIQNPLVRRRKGKRPVIPDAAPAKFKPVQSEKQADKESKTGPGVIPKEESRPSSRDSTSTAPSKPSGSQTKVSTSQTKPTSLKRDGSSLFKAFAKHSTKPKLDRKDSDASTSAPASQVSDMRMADADEEGESEDEALFLDTNTKKAASKKRPADDTKKQERDDKAAKLRKMMDSDDEAVDDLPTVDQAAQKEDKLTAPDDAAATKASTEAKDEVEWSESDTEKPQTKKKEEPEEEISTAPKRRRGKRKIMKKRTMKDEDGYLVTKEEPVWESFSEDEPEPVKQKPKNAFGSIKGSNPSSSQKSTGSVKAGAGGTKKKGDIMSFFGKK